MVPAITEVREPLKFQAEWNEKNEGLASSFLDKICRLALAPLTFLAMQLLLPAQSRRLMDKYMEDDSIQRSHQRFDKTFKAKGYDIQNLEVTTPDGALLKGRFIQSPNVPKNAPVVVFFQPNGALSTSSTGDWIMNYCKGEQLSYNFIVWDYRNVGCEWTFAGLPTAPQQLILDGDSMIQFATKKLGLDPKDIHFYGHSLGGVVGARVKELHEECEGNAVFDRPFCDIKTEVKQLILSITSSDWPSWLTDLAIKVVSIVISCLRWDDLNAAASLEKLKGRNLVTYHSKDGIIPKEASLGMHVNPALQTTRVMELDHQRWIDFSYYFYEDDDVVRSRRSDKESDRDPHGPQLNYFATPTRELALEGAAKTLFGDNVRKSDALWLEDFSKWTSGCQARVYKTVSKLFQNKGLYWGSGEDAFHNRNGLSLTDAQRVQAIRRTWYKDTPL